MKSSKITLVGKFDQSGKFLLANKHELNIFGRKWKNKTLILTGNVEAENGSSLLCGYYMNKIVPDVRQLFKENGEMLTLKKTDERLREHTTVAHVEVPKEESGGFELVRVRTVYELNNVELVEFVEEVRMFVFELFAVQIEDPTK